jgi:hypothetical protein
VLVPNRAVLFEALLEPPQLVLHLFNRPIQGGKYSPGLLDGYKFIMMLRSHAKLQNGPLAMLDIHRDGYGCQPIEKLPQQVDFFGDFLLGCEAQVPVPGRNGRLHRCFSKLIDRCLQLVAAAVSAVGETLDSSPVLISRERAARVLLAPWGSFFSLFLV